MRDLLRLRESRSLDWSRLCGLTGNRLRVVGVNGPLGKEALDVSANLWTALIMRLFPQRSQ